MSLGHGAKIITNGLVFAYDMGPNPGVNKSWKGAPTTNLLLQSTREHTGGMGSYWSGVISVNNTEKGFPSFKITTTNNTRLDGFITSNGGNLTNGVTYTWSADVWAPIGKTVQLRIRNITGGGSRAGSAQNVVGSSSWVRVSKTFTADTNTAGMIEGNEQNSVTDVYSFWVKNLQLEQQPFATPFVNGTRSNTEALLDWTGNNTITANSLTYNSDGAFSFNGSSNFVSAPLSIGTDPLVTINQWIKRTASFSGGGYWGLGGGALNNGINGYTSVTNKIGWDLWGRTTFHTGQDYPLNEWVNVCWVKTATGFTTSTLKIYINGVEYPLTTTVRNNSSVVNIISGVTVGRLASSVSLYHAPGVIGVTNAYNRALTADEVKTNFNALRGRFGI